MTRGRVRSMLAVFVVAGAALLVSAMPAGAADSPAGAADSSAANEWQFSGDFYLWGPDIDAGLQNGGDINLDLEDILRDLDFLFMGGLGVSKGKWSFKTDVIYFDIGQANNGQVTIPGGRPGIDVATSSKVDMKAWIVTPSVGYNLVDTEKASLDVFGGARYLNIAVDLELETDQISDSGDVWDGIGGVRGRVNLAPKWYLPYYADVGAGQSELTWQAFAGIGYHFKPVDVIAGYRYLKWNFKDSELVLDDLTVKGPQVGIAFKF